MRRSLIGRFANFEGPETMTELLTAAQMRAIEQAAIASGRGHRAGADGTRRARRGRGDLRGMAGAARDLAPRGGALRAGQQRRRRVRRGAAAEGMGLGGGGVPLRRPREAAAGCAGEL